MAGKKFNLHLSQEYDQFIKILFFPLKKKFHFKKSLNQQLRASYITGLSTSRKPLHSKVPQENRV